MNKYHAVLLLGIVALCRAREPIKPRLGSLPFLVYFPSRYRGMCVGTLVARTVVITAAVCITNPDTEDHDTRPINVITGATYRHPRRGVRVQVSKILLPNLSNVTGQRGYLMQKSVALLLLKRRVPDVMVEMPLRPLDVDWRGEESLSLHEECFIPGWHFFHKGDKIFPTHKFLLQRNLRVQFVNIVKKNTWCEPLVMKFRQALTSLGFNGFVDRAASVCIKDTEEIAQACHGMYGAPLICRARAVGVMMAPDAQWTNCTGFSNLIHLLHSKYLFNFMSCVSRLFEPEPKQDWAIMKRQVIDDPSTNDYDYVPSIYGRLALDSASSETEER